MSSRKKSVGRRNQTRSPKKRTEVREQNRGGVAPEPLTLEYIERVLLRGGDISRVTMLVHVDDCAGLDMLEPSEILSVLDEYRPLFSSDAICAYLKEKYHPDCADWAIRRPRAFYRSPEWLDEFYPQESDGDRREYRVVNLVTGEISVPALVRANRPMYIWDEVNSDCRCGG
ncbi:hypothetical protein B2J88_01785 [Rhodococcus sp. SRB_17]|nr:hypothetical protein [Rhodococcus sp. SRB_17]